jgi:hypothetical protein
LAAAMPNCLLTRGTHRVDRRSMTKHEASFNNARAVRDVEGSRRDRAPDYGSKHIHAETQSACVIFTAGIAGPLSTLVGRQWITSTDT